MRTRKRQLKKGQLNAFTLTELLVVLVIIGILVLLALPNYDGVLDDARSKEAELQLKHLYGLENQYFQLHGKYTPDMAEVGYQQVKLKTDNGSAVYRIEIVDAGGTNFLARATSVVDFDKDGTMSTWEINSENELKEVIAD
jgi:type IV pilus assembly protein PilE